MNKLQLNFLSPNEIKDIPLKIEVFNHNLNLVERAWHQQQPITEHLSLPDGIFSICASLPSGEKIENFIELDNNATKEMSINLYGISPHESHSWAYAVKNIKNNSNKEFSSKQYEKTWMRFWSKIDGKWTILSPPRIGDISWNSDGFNFSMDVERGMSLLQVGGKYIPWRFITLPPTEDLKCLIKPSNGPSKSIHPLDITITTQKWQTESLLSFLTTGAMDSAQELWNAPNGAEQLLGSKIVDPASAAVGGYYLLKIGKIDLLHDWPRNLANWIDWMPDGEIILAWQLIRLAKHENLSSEQMQEVKRHLLNAVDRGIPIYTEGLRLLQDGLDMVNDDPTLSDRNVSQALKTVKSYASATDWNEPTTTFNGEIPNKPSAKSRKGVDKSDLKLIFIDSPELVGLNQN